MKTKISTQEKVAKINGKFIIFGALIAGAFGLFQILFNPKSEKQIKINGSPKPDTIKSVTNTNNTINQQNSNNANVQIGSDNKK